jgi:hypothetical protein
METLRAKNTREISSDPDILSLMNYYNAELSQKAKDDPKFKAFNKWCLDNGVLHPGVDFPAVFGKNGELMGMAASRDLPPNTAFLYVPFDLTINKITIKWRAPELWKEVFDPNPNVFKKHYDNQYLRLGTYLFYEMLKGENSFWHPYFEVISWTDLPMLWREEELAEF